MPKHTHRVEISTAGAHTHSFSKIKQAATGTARYVPEKPGAAASSTSGTITTSKEGAHTHIATVQVCAEFATTETKLITDENTGTAKPIRIMPPFLTVYMWQRTA